MDDFSFHVAVLNDPNASTEQKLEALDEMQEGGLTFDYQPNNDLYGIDDYDAHMLALHTP